jgi:hypothetical protein
LIADSAAPMYTSRSMILRLRSSHSSE